MASPPGDPPSQYEPVGRWGHCSAFIDGKHYTYGGDCGAGGSPPLSTVEILDLVTIKWQQIPTTGEMPPYKTKVEMEQLYLFIDTHLYGILQLALLFPSSSYIWRIFVIIPCAFLFSPGCWLLMYYPFNVFHLRFLRLACHSDE